MDKLEPRRSPRQPRSKATVDAIAAAAAALLVSEGYDGLTTNKIAEKAGFGIGSVYEYFRNKDEIVVFLIERLATCLKDRTSSAFMTARDVEPLIGLEAAINAVVVTYQQHPSLYKQLLIRAQQLKAINPLARIEKDIAADLVSFLAAHKGQFRLPHVERCAAVSVKSSRMLVEASCYDDSFSLDIWNVEPEMLALVKGYLLR